MARMYWVALIILIVLALAGVGTIPIIGLLLFGFAAFLIVFKITHSLSWRRIDGRWPWTPEDAARRWSPEGIAKTQARYARLDLK